MYNFITFQNKRGTTKLNLELIDGLIGLADLKEEQATIINYICDRNDYNFKLSSKKDLNAITLDEKSLNANFCFYINKAKRNSKKEVKEDERKSN